MRAPMFAFLKGTLKVALFFAIPIAIVLAILKVLYVDVVTVGHNGMAPTLFAGDRVLVWRGADIDHGDVVVCHHPEEPGRYVMGRVVGMNNMSLSAERELLTVNGHTPDRDFQGAVTFVDPTRDGSRRELRFGVETLGNDAYWFFVDDHRPLRFRPIERLSGLYLLGDHRGYVGEDSRAFGVVDPSECVGEVFMLLQPGPQSVEGIPHGWLSLLGA